MKTTCNNDKELTARWRAMHHRALSSLAENNQDGIGIWRKCRRLEAVARQITTAACNGDGIRLYGWPVSGKLGWSKMICDLDFHTDYDKAHDLAVDRITACVRVIFGKVPEGFFVNFDARGAALKIEPEVARNKYGLQTDWGGNGILAAEIN